MGSSVNISFEAPPRPAIRYHGGKWVLADWIIGYFPAHRVYVEPYGGGASVLLRKARSYGEIYNELNDEVYSLFCVLRDNCRNEALHRLLVDTPFARKEFEAAYEHTSDPVEAARRLIVRSFMGFGSAAHQKTHSTGFRTSSDRSGTTPAQDWRNYAEALPALRDRLRGVCIESVDALDLMQQRDGDDYLFYVDPPYVHATRERKQRKNYGRHEMTDRQHVKLARVLRSLKGMVVLSGYNSRLYDRLYADWFKVEKKTYSGANHGAVERTEVLWLNPHCHAAWQTETQQQTLL